MREEASAVALGRIARFVLALGVVLALVGCSTPSYPPAPYYPPGYVASNVVSFGVGVAVGRAAVAVGGESAWVGRALGPEVARREQETRSIRASAQRTAARRVIRSG